MKKIIFTLCALSTFFPLCSFATQDEQEKLFHLAMGIYYPDVVKEKIKDANSVSGASCADLGYMWLAMAEQVNSNDKILNKKDTMRQCFQFAIHWLEKAVSLGDGPAAAKLAWFYSDETLTGLDEEMDSLPKQLEYEKKAFELLQKNSPTSLNLWLLTQYYKTGKGTELNDAKAREIYKKYLDCCKKENVSTKSFDSIATPKDKLKTKALCKNSEPDEQEKLFYDCLGVYYSDYIKKKLDEANKGSAAACEEFGRNWIYIGEKIDENNRILPKKRTRLQCFKFAVDWYEKGVSLGGGDSAAALAWFYSERFITGHNEGISSLSKQLEYEKKAFELWQKNPPTNYSLLTLTEYYKRGKGTEVNEAKAKETYKKYLDYCKKENEPVSDYDRL